MNVLEVRDLHKSYRLGFWLKKFEVLKGLTFSVKKGEVFGFLGPNGAGKSTTIKSILSIVKIDRGQILIDSIEHTKYEARRNLGYLPENPYYYDYLTAREIVEYMGYLSGLDGKKLKENTALVLKKVGLEGKEDIKIRNFSKGMVQRVGLASAIVHFPKLLILDEPMTGLDPIGRKIFRDIFIELKNQGTTIFFSSHILTDVELIADRILILNKGQKVLEDSLISILNSRKGDYEIIIQGEVKDLPIKPKILNIEGNFTKIIIEEDKKQEFLKFLLEEGLDIKSLDIANKNLEDIFSDIIKDERN